MKNKSITSRDIDFAKWYTDVVKAAHLADYSSVKGCIVIEPNGYAIWEKMQSILDKEFKKTGHVNCQMPLLIPENLLKKEGELIEGFAPEVAWVTEGGQKHLDERLCIRPTSETLFCDYYQSHIKSHRDLPKLYNQWCNVLRWEKETRPFLRSREFLWQEGHTVHATSEEAKKETTQMMDIYHWFHNEILAIPSIRGIKTEKEKFSGAEATYTVESLMHDGRALQTGTSHYFGQNFTKPFDIKFQNKEGKEEYAYQTSWGVSTRVIGAVIMAHGDNRGLKLPPKVAPIQVVIVPVAMHKEGVLEKADELYQELKAKFRVELDARDNYTPGFKFNYWEMKGVPVRIEIGPRDIENGVAILVRRDTLEKETVKLEELSQRIEELLENIQKNMYEECLKLREKRTTTAYSLEEIKENLDKNQGYVKTMWCGDVECENKVKEKTGAHSRCMPFKQEHLDDKCAICGKEAKHMVVWGRQY